MSFLLLCISRKRILALFKVKCYLKHFHKNDLKTTQKPQKQSSGGILKKVVLKNFAKLAGQHLCWSLLKIKLQETPS